MNRDLKDCFRIATCPDTDPGELLLLARHESELVRGSVALNPSSPDDAILILCSDESEHVLECIRSRGSYIKITPQSPESISKRWH